MNYEQSDPRIPRIIARLRRVQQQRKKRIAMLATALWLTDLEQASPPQRPHLVFSLSPPSYTSYTGWAMGGAYPNDAPPEPSELGSRIWRCERAMFESSWRTNHLTEALSNQVCADVAAEVERRIEASVVQERYGLRHAYEHERRRVAARDERLAKIEAALALDCSDEIRVRVVGIIMSASLV